MSNRADVPFENTRDARWGGPDGLGPNPRICPKCDAATLWKQPGPPWIVRCPGCGWEHEPAAESAFEKLRAKFKTVAAMYHDAYCNWQVKADYQRRTFDGCRWEGWGDTLDEAVEAVLDADAANEHK
jgi:hypothetical protein